MTTNDDTNAWLHRIGTGYVEEGVFDDKTLDKYSYGGAFATDVGPIRILTINTIIYSVKHTPNSTSDADPFHQFWWLKRQLNKALAEDRKVIIVGHIPPGIETYAYTGLWVPEYVDRYLEIVQNEALGSVISAQVFGHVHADEFRLLPNPARGTGPILLSGALSPVYHNNPSFRVLEIDDVTGSLLDYRVYWAPLTQNGDLQWQLGYSASSEYDSLNLSLNMAAFYRLYDKLGERSAETWNKYTMWYKTNISNHLQSCFETSSDEEMSPCEKDYLCGLIVQTQANFNECSSLVTPTMKPQLLPQGSHDALSQALETQVKNKLTTYRSVRKTYKTLHREYLNACEASQKKRKERVTYSLLIVN